MLDLTLKQRSFLLPPAHGLFAQCHASSIVSLVGGELLAAFFAGTREGAGDTAVWLSRRTEAGWLTPVRAFAEAGLAHWNPVLHADKNRVVLFYKVGATVHEWITRVAVSDDVGHTWGAPRDLVPGDPAPRGPVRNKLLVLSDGTWLAPASIETDLLWDAFTDRSTDAGKTWQRADVPFAHRPATGPDAAGTWGGLAANALWETDLARVFTWDGVIQPSLWESAPGQVHMLMRSTRGKIYRSGSSDAGRSWCAAYPTDLPNNNSGLDLVRLTDGTLVLACNPVTGNWGRRTPISLTGSVDNGATWQPITNMETGEGEFSYPAIIAANSEVHVTYTWNRTNIVHQRFLAR